MKNKFRIIAGALGILLISTFMVGCNNGGTENTETTKEAVSVIDETTEAVNTIDEAEAKEIVFADLCIQETAAENLTVKLENNAYVIAFDWSGYDYQYTVDAVTGDITEIMFDGEVL